MTKIINGYTREKFLEFLRETLIPDLKSDEMYATAETLETAVAFIDQPPTLRNQQDDLWASDSIYTKDAWRREVAEDETHLGYWEWVEAQRDLVSEPALIVRDSPAGYEFWNVNDGWTSDMAQATRFDGGADGLRDVGSLNVPQGGVWRTEAEMVTRMAADDPPPIPWAVGDTVTWRDPDGEARSHTGVLALIARVGPDTVAVTMEDGWEADVLLSELAAPGAVRACQFVPVTELVPPSWRSWFWSEISDSAPFAWGTNDRTLVLATRFAAHCRSRLGCVVDDGGPISHEEMSEFLRRIAALGDTLIDLEN